MNFSTISGGKFFLKTNGSFGILSGILGESADIIILDDPNNTKKFESKKTLESINAQFDDAIYNRLNNAETGFRVVLQQRVHQQDLTGHLLEKELNFEHICLPAEESNNISPPELVEFYEDSLLDPVRLSPKILNQHRVIKGERVYNTQLNQRTSDSGTLF